MIFSIVWLVVPAITSDKPNWAMFGTFLGCGIPIWGNGIYFGIQYNKGIYRITGLKAQVSFIDTLLGGNN